MAGFFGTEQQQRLQLASDAAVPSMTRTPGACNAGRFMATDDPERFGWSRIFEILERDGVFGFRMMPTAYLPTIRAHLGERGYRFDEWDVFMGEAKSARQVAGALAAKGLPDGLAEAPLVAADDGHTRRIQFFMHENGIVPFSGTMLVGGVGPAVAVVIADENREPVATAFTYFGHFDHSPFRNAAWGGLVAVSPKQRGTGLGKLVNAMMVVRCFDTLGATAIYELVSATNIASRRMVEASGLALSPDLKCGLATSGAERFTR